MVGARSYKYPGGPAKHWFAYNPLQHVSCMLLIDNTMDGAKGPTDYKLCTLMQKQRKSDVPPTLSVFLQNKLCYISKRRCSIFLVGLTFGTMVLSICNKQKTADLVTGIVLKPMLRWTPGVFITPGTYHIYKSYALYL